MKEERTSQIEVTEETLGFLKNMEGLLGKELVLNTKNDASKEPIVSINVHPVTLKNLRKIRKLLETKHDRLIAKSFPMKRADNIWLPLFKLRLFFCMST